MYAASLVVECSLAVVGQIQQTFRGRFTRENQSDYEKSFGGEKHERLEKRRRRRRNAQCNIVSLLDAVGEGTKRIESFRDLLLLTGR